MRRVVLSMVFLIAAVASAQIRDLSGSWKLDRDLTTASMRWDKTDTLVLSQSNTEARFDYFDRDGHLFATDTFTTDDVERPRYKTRLERAYSRVRWQDGKLVIASRVNLDLQGYTSYNGYESWELSADGKTLVNRLSDGKAVVYHRQNPDLKSASSN